MPRRWGTPGAGPAARRELERVPPPAFTSPPAQRSCFLFLSQGCGDGTSLRLRFFRFRYIQRRIEHRRLNRRWHEPPHPPLPQRQTSALSVTHPSQAGWGAQSGNGIRAMAIHCAVHGQWHIAGRPIARSLRIPADPHRNHKARFAAPFGDSTVRTPLAPSLQFARSTG